MSLTVDEYYGLVRFLKTRRGAVVLVGFVPTE